MTASAQAEQVTVEVIRYPDNLDRWHFVQAYLQLRKTVFVEEMHWDLFVHDGIEFEQYDTFLATYVLALQGGRVVGGARLLRTDSRIGIYSYMIRDASDGVLEGLPSDLCIRRGPQRSDTWELTRFVALKGSGVAVEILRTCNTFLKSVGARRCLFLGPPSFLRMARSMGFDPRPLGPVTANKDGKFLAFQCAVR